MKFHFGNFCSSQSLKMNPCMYLFAQEVLYAGARGSSSEPPIGLNPIPDSAKDKKARHERTGFFKRGSEID
jgi:hypothetical protein